MPILTHLKDDPDRYSVEYEYGELEKLYRLSRDFHVFSHVMEDRASDMRRLRAFWDEEMACMARIYSRLSKPFTDFFRTTMQAVGDIAIDRAKDPDRKDEENTLRVVKDKNIDVDHSKNA